MTNNKTNLKIKMKNNNLISVKKKNNLVNVERVRRFVFITYQIFEGYLTPNSSWLVGWLKLVDKFTYLGSSVSSTVTNIDTRITKSWGAIDKLSVIRKSDMTDKMKRSIFQSAIVSILLYGCTTWTLSKRLEKKLDGNYTRMLRAILNRS